MKYNDNFCISILCLYLTKFLLPPSPPAGLDPAGLMYHKVPASQRLDPSDADYVDIIHTNGCATLNKWLVGQVYLFIYLFYFIYFFFFSTVVSS